MKPQTKGKRLTSYNYLLTLDFKGDFSILGWFSFQSPYIRTIARL